MVAVGSAGTTSCSSWSTHVRQSPCSKSSTPPTYWLLPVAGWERTPCQWVLLHGHCFPHEEKIPCQWVLLPGHCFSHEERTPCQWLLLHGHCFSHERTPCWWVSLHGHCFSPEERTPCRWVLLHGHYFPHELSAEVTFSPTTKPAVAQRIACFLRFYNFLFVCFFGLRRWWLFSCSWPSVWPCCWFPWLWCCWAVQPSWFAWVNALCNLSWMVTAATSGLISEYVLLHAVPNKGSLAQNCKAVQMPVLLCLPKLQGTDDGGWGKKVSLHFFSADFFQKFLFVARHTLTVGLQKCF